MELSGANYLGNTPNTNGVQTFQGQDPRSGKSLSPVFFEATINEIDRAFEIAEKAFEEYRMVNADKKADFLRRISDEILNLGDELIRRAESETALSVGRLEGERSRTVNQLRMFANLVEEGSWVEASIDRAVPDREPIPKTDIRKMLVPLGPVSVFGASNFPLAFSVAGGDTASALAAGCPVVFKAHPAHPGTSELVARAILKAAQKVGMPDGVFSLIHGLSHTVGLHIVRHPLAQAVGFTGSLAGGRALFDAAADRENPIPVYAEMGSVNPMFLFPSALMNRQKEIAEGLINSVTMGTGQFCTNPGLVFISRGNEMNTFMDNLVDLLDEVPTGTMLYDGIYQDYKDKTMKLNKTPGVEIIGSNTVESGQNTNKARTLFFTTDAQTFLSQRHLSEEVFGPACLIVQVGGEDEFSAIASSLKGQLTTTVHGSGEDLVTYCDLLDVLRQKAGRLIFNGFPTGVEVCASMHHGGPYPATTDIRSTSVGTGAIKRFVRPICYQDFPDESLPPELKDANPLKIWRMIDSEFKIPNTAML